MRASHYIAAIALAALAAPHAHAQTYRWVDERGVVTISEVLPDPGAVVYELDVVQGTASLSALERRSLELINAERRQYKPDVAAPVDAQSGLARAGHVPGAPDASGPVARRGATAAARDPCLLSHDPRCYERNAHNYDPYYGYAPGLQAAGAGPAPASVGSSSPSSGGGSLAGPAPMAQPVAAANPAGQR